VPIALPLIDERLSFVASESVVGIGFRMGAEERKGGSRFVF
jgi:hypothetical protein